MKAFGTGTKVLGWTAHPASARSWTEARWTEHEVAVATMLAVSPREVTEMDDCDEALAYMREFDLSYAEALGVLRARDTWAYDDAGETGIGMLVAGFACSAAIVFMAWFGAYLNATVQ